LEGTSATWPCTSTIHPLKHKMTLESLEWVKSLNVMSDKKLAKFAKYEIMTLVAWAYRRASPEHFRLCSDFMHLFWIIDDRTDEQSSIEVEHEVANIKRILADPSLISPDQGVLEGVCQPWLKSVVEHLKPPPATKARFLRNFISYLDSLPEEARDRETGRLRDRGEHFDLRRRTGGLLPSFDFIYIPFNLSDEVAEHEVVKRMSIVTGDLVIIANDIYSYNVEQAGGQKCVAHNIVDVVMRERQKGVQDAMNVVGASYRELFLSLLDDFNNLPVFDRPEQNKVLHEYALGLMDWVEANVEFSLDSQRYFGAK
ncbi:terpenoid synthase, partial [Dothidotthia symphoricarpi CBS 119687]